MIRSAEDRSCKRCYYSLLLNALASWKDIYLPTDCAGGKYYIGGVKSDFRKSKCFFCSPSSCYRPPFPKDRCRLGREPREERTRRRRGGEGAQQERTRERERERKRQQSEWMPSSPFQFQSKSLSGGQARPRSWCFISALSKDSCTNVQELVQQKFFIACCHQIWVRLCC